MENVQGPSLFRVSVIALAVFVVVTLAYHAFSQQDATDPGLDPTRQPQRVRVVQENDVLLGAGDVRFGVVVQPGGGAVIADWKNHAAMFVDDQGRTRDLGIRLRHQHTGLSIPAEGMAIIEDQQGVYYAVRFDGRIDALPGMR